MHSHFFAVVEKTTINSTVYTAIIATAPKLSESKYMSYADILIGVYNLTYT